MGAVSAEIEHLLKKRNIRNPGYFVFANTTMLLFWKDYTFIGRKCLRKRNNIDFVCYFHSINVQCSYLSVNRVNGIGEKLEFFISTLGRFHCASPIPYHVFISCVINKGSVSISLFADTRD